MGYGWILPVAWFSICVGIALALSSWIVHDKHRMKKIMHMVLDEKSWCNKNCKMFDYVFEHNEDAYQALKELGEYCWECPMAKAVEVWEREQAIKNRGDSSEKRCER